MSLSLSLFFPQGQKSVSQPSKIQLAKDSQEREIMQWFEQ